MGINQTEIDREIEHLRDIYTNLSNLKKSLFPSEIYQRLFDFIDNDHIFYLYREVMIYANSWRDYLDDFRANSGILPVYNRYIEFIEYNISTEKAGEVFANLLLSDDVQADNYIVEYCQELLSSNQDASIHSILMHYADTCAIESSKIHCLITIMQKIDDYCLREAWDISRFFSIKHIERFSENPDPSLLLLAVQQLEGELRYQVFFIDVLLKAEDPFATANLINDLYALGLFADTGKDYFLTLLSKAFIEENSEQNLLAKTVERLTELRTKNKALSPDFYQQILKHADIIFNDDTYELWQFVPKNILDQFYQNIFESFAYVDEDANNFEADDKHTTLISSFLEIDEVILSLPVLLSGKYDEYIYPMACVAFKSIGVSLRELESMHIDESSDNLDSCFKYLPFLIRANSAEYNQLIVLYCNKLSICGKLNTQDIAFDGISIANVIETARNFNEDAYLKIMRVFLHSNIRELPQATRYTLNSKHENVKELDGNRMNLVI